MEDLKWEEADIERHECADPYKLQEFEQLGEAIIVSLADLREVNPLSRLASSPYKKLRVRSTQYDSFLRSLR